VKRALAALVGIAFVFASAGFVAAEEAATKKPVPHTAAGTVKSAGADSLVVSGKVKGKDTEWTFALGDKTRIKKAGKDVTAKDLAAGDKVSVRYTDAAGKMTAMSVSVSAGATKQAAKDEPKK
jgi:hypothetical protein